MKRILLLIPAIICLTVSAQTGYIKKGDALLKKFELDKAAGQYKKAADRDSNDVVAWQKLGETFMLMADYPSAEAVFQTLAAKSIAPKTAIFFYAQALRNNGKYQAADSAYKAFTAVEPTDSRSSEFRNFYTDVKSLLTDLRTYELTNLPENSNSSDIGPAYWYGHVTFSSNRDAGSGVKNFDFWSGKGFYDLYEMKGSNASDIVPAKKAKGKVNKRFNEGPATFSQDGTQMIFTRSNYKKKGEDGIRKLGLYQATWNEKKGWTNITPLPMNSLTYDVAHPALSKDGNLLFFVSDMPGGLGETDLYYCTLSNNTWSAPVNLGKEVNTPGKEMFPFIAPDGTLYFASDSRVGLGGLDIYSASYNGSSWQDIRNPGAPVNSSFDDFGYVCDETGKSGFLVSNRPGGLGDDDIYKFIKRSEAICGNIADAKTNAVIENVNITAISADGEKVDIKTNMKGDFCLNLAPGKTYRLEAGKEGYGKFEGTIVARPFKNEKKNILLEPKGGIDLTVDVIEKGGNKIEGATAFLINKTTGEITQQKSDSTGQVKFDLFKDQEYDLKVVNKQNEEQGMYDKFVKTISTMGFTESKAMNEKAQLTFYDGKLVFDLPNVYFDLNSAVIKPAAKKDLDKVADVMKKFPALNIELSAHTDSRGNSSTNLGLSAMRASACVDYLSLKGADKTHLIAIGFGEEKIRNKCVDGVSCTEAEHAVNRRTEFKVLKFD